MLALPPPPRARVRVAFEMAHGHQPDELEITNALAFVTAYQETLSDDQDNPKRELAAWSALARVLLTSNGFLYVD